MIAVILQTPYAVGPTEGKGPTGFGPESKPGEDGGIGPDGKGGGPYLPGPDGEGPGPGGTPIWIDVQPPDGPGGDIPGDSNGPQGPPESGPGSGGPGDSQPGGPSPGGPAGPGGPGGRKNSPVVGMTKSSRRQESFYIQRASKVW